nr:hypothetical protein [Tanacetum cinerariifolium]
MDARERYFGENSFDGLLIPFLLSSSLSIWLIEAIFSEAMKFLADSGIVDISYFPYRGYARMRIQQRLARDLPCNTECYGDHCISHMRVLHSFLVERIEQEKE